LAGEDPLKYLKAGGNYFARFLLFVLAPRAFVICSILMALQGSPKANGLCQ
jgi:Na+-translocating ferredoxin:NAD+ oxidoreductase RnfE subunit